MGEKGRDFDPKTDQVAHPDYYGGDSTYETIKVAEAWGMDHDAYLFQVLKYITRYKRKGGIVDLEKAAFYLNRKIENMKRDERDAMRIRDVERNIKGLEQHIKITVDGADGNSAV